MQPYDYMILIGQDKDFLHEEFKRLVLPQIVKTLVIWIAFLILLYFFRMKIVNPMVLLSEKARLISRGELDVKMPIVNSSEAAYLVEALEMIKTTFQRESSVRRQLFEANNKIQLINSDLEQKVIERTKDLQHALSVKTEFLNNMSHEIRTPVQGITGLSEGLVESWGVLDEDKRLQIANHVASNGRRLLSLVGNLLDLSKFTAGKMLLTFHKTEFNSLVEDMIEESKTLYVDDKKIKFKFINQEPIYAVIDHERIMQVLRNLFVNAIKFSYKNGIINIISSKTESTDDKGNIIKVVQFSIANKGTGIPDDEIKTIFDPFTQSTKTKTSAGGTGLGLTICREIISGHKGRIWAENNGDSTNFSFIVPVTQLVQTTKTKNNAEANDKQVAAKPANILIIDDEEACLLNMELFLYQSRYTLIKASGGAAGLKYLQEHGISIDLVLLDMMMPDINGLDVLVEIKNRPDLSHLKVILQSGVADEKIVKKAAAIGIDGYIRKPYQKNTVLSEIIKVLSGNQHS
jgi:two-component system sensor histidine kinase ChiS